MLASQCCRLWHSLLTRKHVPIHSPAAEQASGCLPCTYSENLSWDCGKRWSDSRTQGIGESFPCLSAASTSGQIASAMQGHRSTDGVPQPVLRDRGRLV